MSRRVLGDLFRRTLSLFYVSLDNDAAALGGLVDATISVPPPLLPYVVNVNSRAGSAAACEEPLSLRSAYSCLRAFRLLGREDLIQAVSFSPIWRRVGEQIPSTPPSASVDQQLLGTQCFALFLASDPSLLFQHGIASRMNMLHLARVAALPCLDGADDAVASSASDKKTKEKTAIVVAALHLVSGLVRCHQVHQRLNRRRALPPTTSCPLFRSLFLEVFCDGPLLLWRALEVLSHSDDFHHLTLRQSLHACFLVRRLRQCVVGETTFSKCATSAGVVSEDGGEHLTADTRIDASSSGAEDSEHSNKLSSTQRHQDTESGDGEVVDDNMDGLAIEPAPIEGPSEGRATTKRVERLFLLLDGDEEGVVAAKTHTKNKRGTGKGIAHRRGGSQHCVLIKLPCSETELKTRLSHLHCSLFHHVRRRRTGGTTAEESRDSREGDFLPSVEKQRTTKALVKTANQMNAKISAVASQQYGGALPVDWEFLCRDSVLHHEHTFLEGTCAIHEGFLSRERRRQQGRDTSVAVLARRSGGGRHLLLEERTLWYCSSEPRKGRGVTRNCRSQFLEVPTSEHRHRRSCGFMPQGERGDGDGLVSVLAVESKPRFLSPTLPLEKHYALAMHWQQRRKSATGRNFRF